MGETAQIRARAGAWRLAATETRERARRVLALGSLRWDAPAAGLFRSRLRDRAAALHRLADLEDEVAGALDWLAGVLERAHGSPGRPGR